MVDIMKQLQAAAKGEQHKWSMGRIIAYNYTPAPIPELEEWANLILAVAEELRGQNGGSMVGHNGQPGNPGAAQPPMGKNAS